MFYPSSRENTVIISVKLVLLIISCLYMVNIPSSRPGREEIKEVSCIILLILSNIVLFFLCALGDSVMRIGKGFENHQPIGR